MKKYICVICGRVFESSSNKRPYCSGRCKKDYVLMGLDMPAKLYEDKAITPVKSMKATSSAKKNDNKKAQPKPKFLAYENLKVLTWDEKYFMVDPIVKKTMLLSVLNDEGENLTYGQLQYIKDYEPTKFKKLEEKVLELKKGAPSFER
jgi:endogenous inhibitor of DNA gyrase (YacG/DUF329 family)